jgi:hypothetical protein
VIALKEIRLHICVKNFRSQVVSTSEVVLIFGRLVVIIVAIEQIARNVDNADLFLCIKADWNICSTFYQGTAK